MNINELWDKYKVGMMDKNKTVREVMLKTDFIVAIGELISLPLELPVKPANDVQNTIDQMLNELFIKMDNYKTKDEIDNYFLGCIIAQRLILTELEKRLSV